MQLTGKFFSILLFMFLINLDGLSQAPVIESKDCEFEEIKMDEITRAKMVTYELQTVSGNLFKGLHCQVFFADSRYYMGIASSNGSSRTLCLEQEKSQMEFQMAND